MHRLTKLPVFVLYLLGFGFAVLFSLSLSGLIWGF